MKVPFSEMEVCIYQEVNGLWTISARNDSGVPIMRYLHHDGVWRCSTLTPGRDIRSHPKDWGGYFSSEQEAKACLKRNKKKFFRRKSADFIAANWQASYYEDLKQQFTQDLMNKEN